MCPSPCQRPCWLVNQSSKQSHNSFPSSERSSSQIRPCKSDSTWTFHVGRLLSPRPHPHLQPRIAGQPFRVSTTVLLFIFFSLEHIKITLPDPNSHVSSQEAGLKHVCTSGPKQSHMWLLKRRVRYMASGCLLRSHECKWKEEGAHVRPFLCFLIGSPHLIHHLNVADEKPRAQGNVNSSKSFIHSANVHHFHQCTRYGFW